MSKTKNVVIDDQNAAIEREQSQTGLNYAEREQGRPTGNAAIEREQGRPTGNKKQETIKYLSELMATVQMAHFKGREVGVRVNESRDAIISIDLYNFDGDGLPVCDGLKPCTITCDDGSTMTGNVFCMCYDPDDEVTPLVFLFEPDDNIPDIEVDPDDMPEESLQNVVAWLEKTMVPAKPKSNDVTSFFYYMWNKWSEEECKVVFKDDYWPHFWNKWCEAYDTMKGPRGAAELFYMMLSDTNRDKLVKRALELYDGMTEK